MFIKRLNLKELLSFKDSEIELGPLNVLIGPNAVGKSNLIEVIGLLQAAPVGIAAAILRGGGVRQWMWLGDDSPTSGIACELTLSRRDRVEELRYKLEFADLNGFAIVHELLGKVAPNPGSAGIFLFRSGDGVEFGDGGSRLGLNPGTEISVPSNESVFSQFKNPVDRTPITEVGNHFARIRIFREFRTGSQSAARYGISTSAAKDALTDGADNLALVLHELDFLGVHERIRSYLQRFCERFDDVKVNVGEGLARAFLREAGLRDMLSAIRMSDGTLKFLSLLAALFHPAPPPLMCIEEPETGLHPDAMQLVAEALTEASQSMQLIVTTHSEALVDALTDQPDSVLVCERDFDNSTQMKRLSKDHLKEWLEHYSLGQLWRKGEIGGGRW